MSGHEWIHLTKEQVAADDPLLPAVERFRAVPSRSGAAAENWLRERALVEAGHIATYVLVSEGDVEAFYSLGMSEVELASRHRKAVGARHPVQGAVLIAWLARAVTASIDAESILAHAVGIGRIAAHQVGAVAIAVDPFDEDTEGFWRQRFGFRRSRTRRRDADGIDRSRLWLPLLPDG